VRHSQKFCSFLQSARVRSGLSQKEVADALGYKTAQVVSDWERGYRSPPAVVFKKLGKLYDVSAEEFFQVIFDERASMLERKLRKTLGLK
jgi:transcriptional regulator with XRE-family HTH domain